MVPIRSHSEMTKFWTFGIDQGYSRTGGNIGGVSSAELSMDMTKCLSHGREGCGAKELQGAFTADSLRDRIAERLSLLSHQ